jgi:endonuclease/exonuclease/phosphatase family metal-dependent hydrolase
MRHKHTVAKLLLLAGMIALLVGGGGCARHAAAEQPQLNSLRVMTYNIHIGRGIDGVDDLQRIADVITSARVDVVAVQEVDVGTKRTGGVDQAAELGRLTGMHVRFGKAIDFQSGEYGQAVLSRWPIQSFEVIELPSDVEVEQRVALIAGIDTPRGLPPLQFVATHFDHRRDNPRRFEQAKTLNQILQARMTPGTMLLGDLNARPDTPEIQMLLEQWQDTTGDVLTFRADAPDRKIDWILLPKNHPWRIVHSEVINTPASDHLPVVVELELIRGEGGR